MVEHFIDLRLYLGLVGNMGFGEGRFYEDSDYHRERSLAAMMHVRDQVDAVADGRYSSLRFSDGSLFRDELKVRKFLEYCSTNIPGSDEVISLVDSMHGQITFWRKARFNGWSKNRSEELVREMLKFGYSPKGGVNFCIYRSLLAHCNDEAARKKWEAKIEEEVVQEWLRRFEFH